MKIAYVTTYDPSDPEAWSGLGRRIHDTLVEAGGQVSTIGSLKKRGTAKHIAQKIFHRLRGKDYHRDRDPHLLKHYAAQVDTALVDSDCEVVFSPGTIPIAYLQSSKPIAFYTDATFAGLLDYYPAYGNLCEETIRAGHAMEQAALTKCSLALYASEWAAKSALDHYDVDPEKVKVIPFGCSMDHDPSEAEVLRLVEQKPMDQCRLLFVGVDWKRKGGDQAVAIAEELNRRGLKTSLDVVGCSPPSSVPDFVQLHGFVSRRTASGESKLKTLFSRAHFLALPTRAECFGVVFSEASSFGIPSLATDTGGIPTAIRNGRNGWTLPLDADTGAYCDLVMEHMASAENYRALARSCFQEYQQRLRWSSNGPKILRLLAEHC